MQVHSSFLFGIFFGIVFLILFAVARAKRREHRDYDERQLIEQGRAGKLAFWVMVSLLVGYFVLANFLPVQRMQAGVPEMLVALVGLLVFGLYSLAKDAYFARGKSPWPLISLFAVYGVLDLWSGVRCILRGELVRDGQLSYQSVYLACGAVFLILAAAMAMKVLLTRRESSE